MANNPAQDAYNPPSTTDSDFEEVIFSDIDHSDLFWLNQHPNGDINLVHRKISDTEGVKLRTNELFEFKSNLRVYQKI